MKPSDWDAWDVQEPPAGFPAKVVAAAMLEDQRARRGPVRRVLAGLLLVAAVAGAVALVLRAPGRGSQTVVAEARREVRVGGRAVAVLEKGARVAWNGDDVRQDEGDVFWRVEASAGSSAEGARFVVHTPAGEVTVKGTCFRVKVALGATAAAAAIAVLVYEGKVGVSHGGAVVDLVAGESAAADERGVHRTGAVADELPAPPSVHDDTAHTVARLDRARADRMREQIRAFFAEAGPPSRMAPSPPPQGAPAADAAFPTIPVLIDGDGGSDRIDPSYIRQRVHEDLLPLARDCYASALKRDPTTAGKLVIHFRIIGDHKVGGVVDETKLLGGTTLTDPEMQTCVQESMMSVSFDAPPGDKEITVTYPLDFSPEDDDGGAPP